MEQAIVGPDGCLPATGRGFRIRSAPGGIDDPLRSLDDPAGCLVVMETSGGYERTADQALMARGVLAT